jgi:zinc protease
MNRLRALVVVLLLSLVPCLVASCSRHGDTGSYSLAAGGGQGIAFTQETLPNGLQVIYAPMHEAPVVHVRVLYHVGSRDERPDRQGFAHMFEHMMFRGSAHMKPEEHMKLIGIVGGDSNAFTSFDQTTYVNTIPSNHLEMALYLEADRMASFKVSEEIYKVERNVVAKEWGMRQNQPYGTLFEDFLRTSFVNHSYRWTPIGNMEHLRSAPVNELQEFFNKYYVPNNACLIVAGDIDPARAKELVHKYYAWIPGGQKMTRDIAREPEQAEPRRLSVPKQVPLAAVMVGFHGPAYTSRDHHALSLLGSILGDGRSSRLDQLLVNSADPLCHSADAGDYQLEDNGVFEMSARVLPGKDSALVEKMLLSAAADVVDKGVTAEELEKVKTQARIALLKGRETATQVATALGEEAVFGGDARRVNSALADLEAVTPADIQAVARKYLQPNRATIVTYIPDPLGKSARAAATQAAAMAGAEVTKPTRPIEPRPVTFPPGYPEHAPLADARSNPQFKKGEEFMVNGVKVIVMTDSRVPLVNWSLNMRRGGHAEPKGKEGLGSLTASLVRRGSQGLSYDQINQDLESRGISIELSDGGDHTRLSGSCTVDQLDHAMARSADILHHPTFPADEFAKLKAQSQAGLQQALANPTTAAGRELSRILFGDTPVGRHSTPKSIGSITIEDIKGFYNSIYRPNDAFLILSGDLTVERGRALAEKLLAGWEPTPGPAVDYTLPPAPSARKIVLIDNPDGKQSVIRMGIRGYDIRTDDKFAGSLAGQILSAGIDSRLGKYVRAEKGYVYGVAGYFMPDRHSGVFNGFTETGFETTAATIEAMFKVFNDMKAAEVTPQELSEAKNRVAGSMVMQMQTINQQAGRRADAILNGYPADYYDTYPARVAQVTAGQVREVLNKYVDDGKMTIIVAAPAGKVKEQLEKLGPVEVIPMPARRGELLKGG